MLIHFLILFSVCIYYLLVTNKVICYLFIYDIVYTVCTYHRKTILLYIMKVYKRRGHKKLKSRYIEFGMFSCCSHTVQCVYIFHTISSSNVNKIKIEDFLPYNCYIQYTVYCVNTLYTILFFWYYALFYN